MCVWRLCNFLHKLRRQTWAAVMEMISHRPQCVNAASSSDLCCSSRPVRCAGEEVERTPEMQWEGVCCSGGSWRGRGWLAEAGSMSGCCSCCWAGLPPSCRSRRDTMPQPHGGGGVAWAVAHGWGGVCVCVSSTNQAFSESQRRNKNRVPLAALQYQILMSWGSRCERARRQIIWYFPQASHGARLSRAPKWFVALLFPWPEPPVWHFCSNSSAKWCLQAAFRVQRLPIATGWTSVKIWTIAEGIVWHLG